MGISRQRTFLPHILALLYGLALVFASLEPFAPWMRVATGTPFWPLAPWPPKWTRFDVIVNMLAYVPFGVFVALVPQRGSPFVRTGIAVAAGASLSFGMETLQMFLPTRSANLVDLMANTAGALLGGLLGGTLVRAERTRRLMSAVRDGAFLSGGLGDMGIALLALWLTAQTNPGIALFALHFEPGLASAMAPDTAATMLEVAQTAFQLVGVGLFLALLLRDRRHVGGAVLLLIGTALMFKGIAAWLLLKPAAWETWLRPGVSIGIAAGSLGLLLTAFLPRPAQVAVCAIALLSSLLLPLLASDSASVTAPLTLFDWRYGHLLNFNGLTHTVLLAWPLVAAAWLFALAGKPDWGQPD
ncbi:MAG: VanZ family protein [Betaproteobacteria bacterium]